MKVIFYILFASNERIKFKGIGEGTLAEENC